MTDPQPALAGPPTAAPTKRTWKNRATPAYLWALVHGGTPASVYPNPNKVHPLADGDDFDTIIEEGRRQIDAQRDDFNTIRGRAQDRITVTLVVLAFSSGVFARLHTVHGLHRLAATSVWGIGFLLVVIGLGMAASAASVRGDFEAPDTTQLSDPGRYPRPLKKSLAEDYAGSVRLGAVMVADRANALFLTTRWIVWGAFVTAIGFLLTT